MPLAVLVAALAELALEVRVAAALVVLAANVLVVAPAVLAAAALVEPVALVAQVGPVAVVPAVLGSAALVLVVALEPHLHTSSDLFAAASPHLEPDIATRRSLDPSPSALLPHPSFDCH